MSSSITASDYQSSQSTTMNDVPEEERNYEDTSRSKTHAESDANIDECDTVVVEAETDNVAFEIEMVATDAIGNEELVVSEEQVIENDCENNVNLCSNANSDTKHAINECSIEISQSTGVNCFDSSLNSCESEKSQNCCEGNADNKDVSEMKQITQDCESDNASSCFERNCSLQEPTPSASSDSSCGLNQTSAGISEDRSAERHAANCGTVLTPPTSVNNLSPSLVADSTTTPPTGLGIHKKKFGKFRILLNNEQNQATNNSCATMQNQESSNDAGIVSEDSCSFDSKSEKCTMEPFVPPTLLRQQEKMLEKDVSQVENENESKKALKIGKKKNSTKKRGNKNAVNKKGKTVEPLFDFGEEAANRRRSSRIKSLEERKEQERAEREKTVIEPCPQVKSESDEKESNVCVKEKCEKEKKNKSKKHKDDKDKSRKKKNRKKKSNSHIFEDDSSGDGNIREQKTNFIANENTENKASLNSDCFTPPLPPSQLNALKTSNSNMNMNAKNPTSDSDESPKPEKVKSRWRRSSELESGHSSETSSFINTSGGKSLESFNNSFSMNAQNTAPITVAKETEPVPAFEILEESVYLFERRKSKSKKEVRRMVCDCILTKEERNRGIVGCGDDCLNRMLMIECGSRCPLGDHCANKRFQKRQYAKVDPFRTEKKGWGLRTLQPLQAGAFIMEYVGEVLAPKEFKHRVEKYSKENRVHHYFMALKNDEIIDATYKGNLTRFVNHSCEPNVETQKWTVNGELRIGFFAKRNIEAGEEVTFDYQFQRYGEKAQPCYCESSNCRGFIGATSVTSIDIDGSRLNKTKEKLDEIEEKTEEEFEDLALEEEIEKLTVSGGLRNRQQTLMLARLMVRAEDSLNRQKLLQVMKSTHEIAYLRLLLDYHGLQLLWSWMFELEDVWLKAEILEVLEILPIPNKTMLKDSKVLDVVEKWSKQSTEHPVSAAAHTLYNSISVSDQPPKELSAAKATDESRNNEEASVALNAVNKVDIKTEVEESTSDAAVDKSAESVTEVKGEGCAQAETETGEVENGSASASVAAVRDAVSESSSSSVTSKTVVVTVKCEKVAPIVQEVKGEEPKPVPNIVALTAKLLNSWKDLKEVFRIPRLERQKRHEDEKEADRRTKELEERKARGLPIVYDKNKRGIDDRDNTIAGILGLRKKAVKRQAEDKKVTQNNVSPHNLMNDMSTPTPPKVNKDAHRLQFEMELMRKQYEEAMKAYQKQMMQYHAMVQQQIMQPQAPSLHFPNNFDQMPLQPPHPPHPMQPPLPPQPHPQFYCENNTYHNQRFPTPNSLHCGSDLVSPSSNSFDDYCEGFHNSIDDHHEKRTSNTRLSNSCVLIECTSDEHFLRSDEKAVITTDYGIELVPNEKSKSSIQLFDRVYPSPGTYYCHDNKTYFVPQPFDHKGDQINPCVFDDIKLPSPASMTKDVVLTAFPRHWSGIKDVRGDVYYYNKATRKAQWNLPEEDMNCVADDSSSRIQSESVVISSADSTSTPKDEIEVHREVTPVEMNGDQECTPDANPADCSATPLNSLPGSQVFEPDPRKRKYLTNAVVQMLSTVASNVGVDNSVMSSLNCNRYNPTSESRSERKLKEKFKAEMSEHIKHCLNPFRKVDCKVGRIVNNEDFKYLARKLTHFVMVKELKHCRCIEELSCNETVKHKAKDYVKKYMASKGPVYKSDAFEDKDDKNLSPKDGVSLDSVPDQSVDGI